MTQIKIISNPYKQEITYKTKENSGEWTDVSQSAPNGKLREESARKCFVPFHAKEIMDIIADEYYISPKKGPVEIIFEGTKEEYDVIQRVCQNPELADKFCLVRSDRVLDNGKYILSDTKEIFEDVRPVIEAVTRDDETITKDLSKVKDTLNDIVPICVFGNYSAGKSTFINALIGREIMPSGGDPVTAKAFKIQNSDQPDIVRIRYTHWEKAVELSFEDDECRVVKGDSRDEMLVELGRILKEDEFKSMYHRISTVLEFINAYEKRDTTSTEISNMIEVNVPFSKNGILGRSNAKFVIFDTPGSNTATNADHIDVLKEALEGFSNGIPVWISQYETIDTMDNESLCNNIMSIDALDQRFTMIVLNKADVSDLPEHGFSEKQIKNIREFRSVEKMYASGIFFVSSIMGLGSKVDGNLTDKFYRKIYKLQKDSFSTLEDEDYMMLYRYNIMPEQIKQGIIARSADEKNIVYVNSGLHCIEAEIEEFAGKYSSYNKCQMVYTLLLDVLKKTTGRIEKRVEARKKLREKYISELEEKKQQLINEMRDKSAELDNQFSSEAYKAISGYAKENLDYDLSVDKLNELNKKYVEENTSQYNLEEKRQDLDQAVDQMVSNIKERVKRFSVLDLKGSFSSLAGDAKKGLESIYNSRKELDSTRKSASAETADEVLQEVIEIYKSCMADAVGTINRIACNHWEEKAKELKDTLVDIVTVSDALTESQKQTLSKLIFSYQEAFYDDEAGSIFVKPKFLYGHLLGLDLFILEKLNTGKLAKEYNVTVANNIDAIVNDLNEKYYNSYTKWQEELNATIERNIVDFNPELQVLSESIDNETEKINSLESSQQKIRASLKAMENLISFKMAE